MSTLRSVTSGTRGVTSETGRMSGRATPATVALPRALDTRRKTLHPSWRARIVFGLGTIPGTEPAPPPDPKARHIGKRTSTRTTVDVDIPVGSVSLRCAHPSGVAAVASWCYRIDRDKWAFDAAWAWIPGEIPPDPISAPRFAALVSRDPSEDMDKRRAA